jgi:7-cyano-7-deazaguanine synthase in queuosine biosynthesis
MILVLFSGGVESTVLLKYFLKETKQIVHVLNTELGYIDDLKPRLIEQKKAAYSVLDYFKKNYREFNFSSVQLNLNNINALQQQTAGFGYDEQWNLFFASMYAKIYQIKDIWIGDFSYIYDYRKELNLPIHDWYFDGTLEKFALLGSSLDFSFFKDLKINFPSRNFKKTSIDSFNSKKEAFDYLEPGLKKLIRSCVGKEKFCGKCIKCIQYVKYKLTNEKGEII